MPGITVAMWIFDTIPRTSRVQPAAPFLTTAFYSIVWVYCDFFHEPLMGSYIVFFCYFK